MNLGLPFHRIQEIPPLPWFPHLQSLYLQDNMITTCAAMENLPSLGILNLAHNCLESIDIIRALLPLSAIERLDLNGNPVEDDPRFVPPTASINLVFKQRPIRHLAQTPFNQIWSSFHPTSPKRERQQRLASKQAYLNLWYNYSSGHIL